MKRLDYYIIKNFLSKLFLILLSFLLIFFTVDIIDKLDKFSKYSLTNQEIIDYYIYTLPEFISFAFPVSLLLSTIFCFTLLQKNNEITALKASGISLRRISSSILIMGFLFSIISFFFDNYIVIDQLSKRNHIEKKLNPNKSNTLSRKNNIYYHVGDTFLGIKRFNFFNNIGQNISIQKSEGADVIYRIDAEKMIWQENNKKWLLKDINIRKWNKNKLNYYSIEDSLIDVKDISPEIIKKDNINPEDMSYWELSLFIEKLKDKGLSYNRWLVNKNFKTAFACSPLIMMVFGLALSIQKPRGNQASGVGLSIIVIFMYYLLIKFGQSLGYNNVINPFISVWMVNFIFLIFGSYLFLKSRT